MHLVPESYGARLREHNDCHAAEDGKFCSGPGAKRQRLGRRRGGDGYQIQFRSALSADGRDYKLTGNDVPYHAKHAKVVLTFEPWMTAQLGAPGRWKAPNGVEVLYLKGQRRTDGGTAVYHDFSAADELVVPLTRNIGSGRRALRAWAAAHLANRAAVRMQARQMVRPGD